MFNRVLKVDWPISDIVKNYNHVMDSIKVSTGNVKQKDPAKIKAGLRGTRTIPLFSLLYSILYSGHS